MLEWFNKRKKLRNSLIVLGSLLAILFIAINIIISIQDISELKQAVPQPTLIYDANNEVATKLASSKTEGVKRKDIPDIMVQAIVAVEDKEFLTITVFTTVELLVLFLKISLQEKLWQVEVQLHNNLRKMYF